MAKKNNRPAAVATAGGVKGSVVLKKATIAQSVAFANSFAVTSIRRGPGGKADWLVSIEGVCADVHVVCTDVPMRDRQLRKSKRFCNVLWHRFGINFDPMPQIVWSAIVAAAIAKGGA
jgi:hypothetical protein